jgi:hypothetical protein
MKKLNKPKTINSFKHNKMLVLILFLISILFITIPANAQSSNSGQTAGKKPPTPLLPDSKSQIILDSVNMSVAPDGSITIQVTSGPLSDASEFAYDFQIDKSKKSYSTKLVNLNQIQILPIDEGSSGENTEKNIDNTFSPNAVQPLAISPGTYQATIRVQTLDLVFIVLAQTTDYLKWTVNSNGAVQWNSFTDGCTGFTTSLGTHWYVSSCTGNAPYYSGGVVYNYVAGSYHNWDWGNPNLSTNSSHTVTVGGKNDGHCTYTWSYTDSGEDAGLTWGRRVVVQCP